jgi:16S rRNA (adenine1518-N6/adenine1519-N6)-dimethyltransferase
VSRTSTASSSPRRPPGDAEGRPAVPESAEAVRRTLERLGVRPSRSWGQSFLIDPFVADAEAALLEVPPGRPILEIGGGLGILTAAMLRRGLGPVTVIERDPRLAAFLRATFANAAEVVTADALEVELPRVDVAVGNLPYSTGTAILQRLFAARVPRVVFLVQREVAERIAAGPGSKEYGRLSIFARLYGTVELYRSVAPEAFAPRPKVASRLAVHVAREGPLPVTSVATLERVVHAVFSSRRKQLSNLIPRLVASPEQARRVAEEAGWPPDWGRRRPEEFSPEAFFRFSNTLDRTS